MAFDLFLHCFRDGRTATFKRALAVEILGRDAVDSRDPVGFVRYRDESGSSGYCDDGEDIDGVMFNHFGGEIFFDRLWELADRTGSCFYWPDVGRPNIAVTRQETIDHLPPSMVKDFGPPWILHNGMDIYLVIEALDRFAIPGAPAATPE